MTDTSNLVRAVHGLKIGGEAGDAQIATNRVDANGAPIFKRVGRKIAPGTLFDLHAGKTRDYLFAQGAVELPNAGELALWEKLHG